MGNFQAALRRPSLGRRADGVRAAGRGGWDNVGCQEGCVVESGRHLGERCGGGSGILLGELVGHVMEAPCLTMILRIQSFRTGNAIPACKGFWGRMGHLLRDC